MRTATQHHTHALDGEEGQAHSASAGVNGIEVRAMATRMAAAHTTADTTRIAVEAVRTQRIGMLGAS